ncbi:serine palmitoyltransferase [Aspergillus steynii IBT 23096]|uniref:Serine palmitoyltransferase n=1 Tax=Aspergillus steynii IBT 23096 TaxID=1392250 RepID=A0A2I2GBK4_9EURO|nr:serine palmitoyltransferase [Aspergillus steynii IBT 23096]PLB50235.1 serine palmitoyltransferase [Aspergillus steynii IBT 23096]
MNWLLHFIAVLLLSLHVGALPSGPMHGLEQRDLATENEQPSVIVYVNEIGQTLSVKTLVPSATAPVNAPTDISSPPPASGTNVPSPDSPISLSPAAQDRFGVTYAPFNDDSTCKSQDQVNQDMDKIARLYSFVRIYGVDCDQTRKVVQAARERNIRVFAGVFDLQNFPASLDEIIRVAAGDWSTFHSINIGNELVNKGQNSVSDVVNAVNTARRILRSAGYQGPVVTVDTFSVLLNHPELCHVSDYCAANCHAFFDANMTPDRAGAYALEQSQRISAAAGGKHTVITESGWPHHGHPNGRAVPSRENQYTAIITLSNSFGRRYNDLIFHSAFDDLWKQDTPDSFGAEKYWGLETW